MERLASHDLRRLSEFLRGLYAARDLDGFVDYALSALPRVISSELTAYGNLNPPKGIFKITGKPVNIVTPKLVRIFDAHAQEHPLSQDHMGGGNGQARRISDLLPRPQFQRLALYNEFFRTIRIDSEMVVWLPAPRPREITFAVHRSRSDFSERDRLVLDLLRPHLAQAHRNAEAFKLLIQAASHPGHVPILLDHESRADGFRPEARQILERYFKAPSRAGTLPESLRRWVKHKIASLGEAESAPPPREPLVIGSNGRRLTIRLLSGPVQHLLLLREDQTTVNPSFLRALGLTSRESEVLTWVAQGKTNEEIATILGMSPRTVAKHLERMYPRLGVENRTAAAARALEVLRSPQES